MVITRSSDEALRGRYTPHGNRSLRCQFIGDDRHKTDAPDDRGAMTPVAFLVEQAPGTELRAHFHVANQFQVFVAGAGRIGGRRAAVGLGHFVGPYSGYGPIVGGDEGISYMTLRNAWDGGAQFLPERIDEVRARRGSRREVLFDDAPSAPDELARVEGSRVATLTAEQPDGLLARAYRLGPGAAVDGPPPAHGGGQFWLVMGGSLRMRDTAPLPRLSLAFVSCDEAPLHVVAGATGLHVLLLQFPRP